MSRQGIIYSGSYNVRIGSKDAARTSDLVDHGGSIRTGCERVVIGGAGLLAARATDRFDCPESDLTPLGTVPHTGGIIVGGCTTVLIGGLPAARIDDPTLCLGPAASVGGGSGGGGGGDGDAVESECEKLWKALEKEAHDMIAPVDHDDRLRNKVISGAYADLCLKEPMFQWAGLAAYASKQVGCAMDHCDSIARSAPQKIPGAAPPGARGVGPAAEFLKQVLGAGNRELFLDIYPMHRFFQLHGFAKMKQCASERRPPLPAQAMDGFKALDDYKKTGDPKYLRQSVRSLALHEQINILQKRIYVDKRVQALLRANEVEQLPGTLPADVVMEAGCVDSTGGKRTHKFGSKGRTRLYDVNERMDWILNDIATDYDRFAGTPRHKADLGAIKGQGADVGGKYP
jgi:uncharacterized Zn-binding protein involved in type VI secretion